jgi:flagellar assembly protein FliH
MPVDLMARQRRTVSPIEFLPLTNRQGSEETRRQVEDAGQTREAQVKVMVQAARAEAKAEALRECEEEMVERLAEERTRVQRIAAAFALDRQRYFGAAEVQVVRLALAIASRVLAREVSGDRMHLEATVRAALARVQDESATMLRVAVNDVAMWKETFAGLRAPALEVVGDERLSAGECVLATSVGRVELGVKVQMAEIERSFHELMPRVDAAAFEER